MFYFLDDKLYFNGVLVARIEPFLSPRIRQELEDELKNAVPFKEVASLKNRLSDLEWEHDGAIVEPV